MPHPTPPPVTIRLPEPPRSLLKCECNPAIALVIAEVNAWLTAEGFRICMDCRQPFISTDGHTLCERCDLDTLPFSDVEPAALCGNRKVRLHTLYRMISKGYIECSSQFHTAEADHEIYEITPAGRAWYRDNTPATITGGDEGSK